MATLKLNKPSPRLRRTLPAQTAAPEFTGTKAQRRGQATGAVLEWLAGLSPVFRGKPRPLAVGIADKIMALPGRPAWIKPHHVRRALARWCSSTPYLRVLATTHVRYSLAGKPVGVVSTEHQQTARERLNRGRR